MSSHVFSRNKHGTPERLLTGTLAALPPAQRAGARVVILWLPQRGFVVRWRYRRYLEASTLQQTHLIALMVSVWPALPAPLRRLETVTVRRLAQDHGAEPWVAQIVLTPYGQPLTDIVWHSLAVRSHPPRGVLSCATIPG